MISEIAAALKTGNVESSPVIDFNMIASIVISNLAQIPVTLHPLGFVHFDVTSLAGLGSGEFARLHIWDPTLSPPDEGGSIHDHTWDLYSLILSGSIRNRNYRPTPSTAGKYSAVQVIYGEENAFSPAGRYGLELVDDRCLSEGDIYMIPSRIVHDSRLLTPRAVTLVIGRPDDAAQHLGPLILREQSSASPGTKIRQQLTAERAREILLTCLPRNKAEAFRDH